MKENYDLKTLFINIFINIIFLILGIGIGVFVVSSKSSDEKHNTKPIEEKIDSLNKVVEKLEAIKNDKIEEIKNLDDSTTLNLFNELVSK